VHGQRVARLPAVQEPGAVRRVRRTREIAGPIEHLIEDASRAAARAGEGKSRQVRHLTRFERDLLD
jgi:hypothetical protein